jgi:hypothetical protein
MESSRWKAPNDDRQRALTAMFRASSPRSWTERSYHNLVHFNELPRGSHFAAWEQPQLFTEELRAGFRSLRTQHADQAA